MPNNTNSDTHTATIPGRPAPQGSKRAFVIPGTNRASVKEDSKASRPWRADAVAALVDSPTAPPEPLSDGAYVRITFQFRRPPSHYTTKGALTLRAPRVMRLKPDIDKLTRNALDALVAAGWISDDSIVTDLIVRKVYVSPSERECTEITVMPWRQTA